MLQEKGYIKSSWWAQSVTVGYEYAKGRRVVGQTKDAGFQIGVQKILPAPPQKLWSLLISKKGLTIWLGDISKLNLKNGSSYKTADDIQGQVRSLKAGEKIRLTYQPKGWKTPSTLQISLFCPRNTKEKTNLRFHQEKLKDAETRAAMRTHWGRILTKLSLSL